VRQLVAKIPRPLLVDGDGLTAVAADLKVIRRRAEPTVLTPHPGEAARLAGCTIDEISADPVASVQRLAADNGAMVVLKGAHSLIGMPDGRVFINTSGNAGLATAGSGDVLTGAIAAMYGLGLELEEAVKAGVFVHGLAGDFAADEIGEDGVTARDVLEHLPEAVAALREDYEAVTEDCCGAVAVV
jgi:ADP-dependent NAD(P)H-hydrate dehydratase / NAD(P)H-hydrate epimerase